jgi:hypothetical protein
MYRSQHFGIQYVRGSDDDTFVPEIVSEILLHPYSVLAKYRSNWHIELYFINLLLPE